MTSPIEGQPLVYSELELQFQEDSQRILANAVDISYGGIGLHSPKRVPVGHDVVVHFKFLVDRSVIQVEAVPGMVKWCRPMGFSFSAGIQFTEIDPEEYPLLASFLRENGTIKSSLRPQPS